MSETDFRTPEQEVVKLLEECADLRRAVAAISTQLARIESRVKRAFPAAAEQLPKRTSTVALAPSNMTRDEALDEFDRIAKLAASGDASAARHALETKLPSDLLCIAKELGISFTSSKPSKKTLLEAVFGKIRESVLLSKHSNRPR
jgi:hypothetical protein